jgi:hypothetical protein
MALFPTQHDGQLACIKKYNFVFKSVNKYIFLICYTFTQYVRL